jgi:hypothetical protein
MSDTRQSSPSSSWADAILDDQMTAIKLNSNAVSEQREDATPRN